MTPFKKKRKILNFYIDFVRLKKRKKSIILVPFFVLSLFHSFFNYYNLKHLFTS